VAVSNSGAYAMAALSVGLVSIAQLSLKLDMSLWPLASGPGGGMDWSAMVGTHLLWLLLGLACYGASMLLWILVLTRLSLSVAYPLLSISYVLVYLVATSMPAWGEVASWQRSGGIAFILLGVVLVSWPQKRTQA
jgi:undecaprenyl phosphate-alpha-L-ara4N flippase subunit ArnF